MDRSRASVEISALLLIGLMLGACEQQGTPQQSSSQTQPREEMATQAQGAGDAGGQTRMADTTGSGSAVSLQGVVRSETEGWMEGVLVSARKPGGTVTVTVVSNAQGRYQFLANRLGSGSYRLSVRAAGYELSGPAEVEVSVGGTAQQDLRLVETQDLASQLMNAEWMVSLEQAGYAKQTISKLNGCVGCHSLTRVMTSKHDAEGWEAVLARMQTYGPGGQKLPYDISTHPRTRYASQGGVDKAFTEFLGEVNLSTGNTHSYELQTFPRPTGKATNVVITEYDLPIDTFQPHEVLVDPDGIVWATDFISPTLLKMDISSGEFTAYDMPILKPEAPKGNNCLELDGDGNLWWTGLKQSGVYRFNTRTEEFSAWKLPSAGSVYSHNGCITVSPDGTVWANEQYLPQVQRLYPDTGEFILYDPFPENRTLVVAENPQPQGVGYLGGRGGIGGDYEEMDRTALDERHSLYGSTMHSNGTWYGADIGAGFIVKIAPDTKAATLYQTPTPNSAPRKIQMDSQDRIWIGEYRAGKIAMFDTATTEYKEWSLRTPYAGAYDADIDKAGDVWSGGQQTDYLYRLDPETDEVTRYLFPSLNVNVRNMAGVDNRTTPVSVWVGENHQNKLARFEFPNRTAGDERVAVGK